MNTDPSLGPILASLDPTTRANLQQAIAGYTSRAVSAQIIPGVDPGPTGQRFTLWNKYYSVVRFQGQVDVSAPTTTITFPATELRPFGYRIGDPLTQAGFDASQGIATDADTNLVKASETNAGQQVEVHGISLMPSSITDIGLWKLLCAHISVKVSMDGDAQQYRLGRMDMIPGGGGTTGSGITSTIVPDLDASVYQDGSFSNGWSIVDNYYPFPQPIIWTPSGETDSNFNILLRLVRQQVSVQTARSGGDGIAPYTPPTATGQFGTYIDVMCHLHAVQRGARSVNQ